MKQHVVPRDWKGQTTAIVASGPSVSKFDFERIAGLRQIAVKDGFLKVPSADVLLIGDHRYAKRRESFEEYKGPLILYTDEKPLPPLWTDPRIEFIPKVAGRGLSSSPHQLRGTFTTTALAINYAVLRGSRRILLVGVDAKAAKDGRRWFSGDRKEDWHDRYARQQWGYRRLVDDLKKRKIEVFNLNPDSAVKTFPVLLEGV